jgi:hypothetical protein
MKRLNALLLLLVLSGVGCKSLSRLPGLESPHSTPNPDAINPADFYVTGTTVKDHQSVYVNISSRTITVEVMRPNETAWITLERVDPPYNPYQLFTIPVQGVHFGDRAERDANGSIHLYTGTPSAPIGTQYRIHSVAK